MKYGNKVKKILIMTLVIAMIAQAISLGTQARLTKGIQKPKLEISVPSWVYEGESFSVSVTADGAPIEGATVGFLNCSYTTDDNGTVVLTAPEVVDDMSFTIFAYKVGYISDSAIILVINIPKPQLEISAPSSVVEGESFSVLVTADGAPIEGATVGFLNCSYTTDDNGTVVLTAPEVEVNNMSFTIFAFKEGYVSDSAIILVINVPKPELEISVPSWVYEGESFSVSVTADGAPIEGATVGFLNCSCTTDDNGTVVLTAPEVDYGNWSFSISASKEGYESDSAIIWVRNKLDPSHFKRRDI